jgi:hypothetical protein
VTRNPDSSPTYFSFRGGRILGVLVEIWTNSSSGG